jgi:serine protease Do
MKDSAAAIRAIVNCVSEHPPGGPPSGPSPAPETTISGTGFFVAPKRVVTNNHVVSGCTKDIQVRYPDGRPYAATISGQDPNNDLVLLQTDMDNLSIAAFRFWPRIGEQVASYGFPYSGVLSSSGNFTLGHVTSLTGVKDDTRFLQMSAPIQPGNSGGAVLDMSGSVIGVAVARLDAIANSIPQNVNFAIQTPTVVNFLLDQIELGKLRRPACQRRSSSVNSSRSSPPPFSPARQSTSISRSNLRVFNLILTPSLHNGSPAMRGDWSCNPRSSSCRVR